MAGMWFTERDTNTLPSYQIVWLACTSRGFGGMDHPDQINGYNDTKYVAFDLILVLPSHLNAAESSSFLRQTLQNFFLYVLLSDQQ